MMYSVKLSSRTRIYENNIAMPSHKLNNDPFECNITKLITLAHIDMDDSLHAYL
ncbi:hypothetical protein D3C81_1983370 [compost metagenome]